MFNSYKVLLEDTWAIRCMGYKVRGEGAIRYVVKGLDSHGGKVI